MNIQRPVYDENRGIIKMPITSFGVDNLKSVEIAGCLTRDMNKLCILLYKMRFGHEFICNEILHINKDDCFKFACNANRLGSPIIKSNEKINHEYIEQKYIDLYFYIKENGFMFDIDRPSYYDGNKIITMDKTINDIRKFDNNGFMTEYVKPNSGFIF